MRVLSRLTSPVVSFLSASTSLILRLLRIQAREEPPVTEDEIRMMIEQGTRAGVFETVEQDLVESVFQLDDRHVSAFMTPYTDVVWLDVNAPLSEIRRVIEGSGFSAYPVCAGSLDNLVGVVHAKDMLLRCIGGGHLVLADHLDAPQFVPENVVASRAIHLFKEHERHIVVVIDEHGGIQGVLTEHDLLEAFVGDIPSRGESEEQRAVQRHDGSWLMDGLLHIDEVKERLDVQAFPEAEEGVYETLSGFVMQQIERIPVAGDRFKWGGWIFEVVDMDQRRVDKVLVQRDDALPPAAD
jgi:putative hemolysin